MIVRAVEGKNRSVIYIFSDGSRLIRSGGTWTWRNNNPGAMKRGPRSRRLGAIGGAGGFAVFPDYKTGRDADRSLLLSVYTGTTLLQRKVRDLTAKEIEVLLDAIQRIEGFKIGKEEKLGPPTPIIDVKRDKRGHPTGYLIEDLGWLSPIETVKGILAGEIDGVVAHRGGKTYVKTRPDGLPDNNLSGMGQSK